jgi:hypothetical protein
MRGSAGAGDGVSQPETSEKKKYLQNQSTRCPRPWPSSSDATGPLDFILFFQSLAVPTDIIFVLFLLWVLATKQPSRLNYAAFLNKNISN